MTYVDAEPPLGPDEDPRPHAASPSLDLDVDGPLFDGVEVVQDEGPLAGGGWIGGDGTGESGDGPAPGRGARRHIGRYVAAVAIVAVVVTGAPTGPTLWQVFRARHTTLNLPAEVAGLARDTGSDSQDTADYLRDAVDTGTSLSDPLAAVYDAGGDKTHSVLLFGGTGTIFRPGHTLTTVLAFLDDSADAVSGLHDVPAGPLGGVMKCGISVGSDDPADADMPICGWADHGSVVAALFPGRTAAQAEELMRQFRAAIEHR
jgi:hypothetical protein